MTFRSKSKFIFSEKIRNTNSKDVCYTYNGCMLNIKIEIIIISLQYKLRFLLWVLYW